MAFTKPASDVPEVAGETNPGRDRAVDVARLGALVVVMFGHCALLLATIDTRGLRIGNLLGEIPDLAPLTWVAQIMPLFFLAGGAAGAYGWRPGTPWGAWLFTRAQRLCRPAFWYLAAWTVGVLVVRVVLGPASAAGIGRESVALLWFLGVYLVALAFVPALMRLGSWRGVAAAVVGLIAAAAVVDGIRIAVGTPWAGAANLLIVWLIPVVIGVGYAKKLVLPRPALAVAAAALAAQVVVALAGPYEVALVVTGAERMSNVSPHAAARAALHLDVLRLRRRVRPDPAMGEPAAGVAGGRHGQRRGDDHLPLAHPGDRGRHLRATRRRPRRLPGRRPGILGPARVAGRGVRSRDGGRVLVALTPGTPAAAMVGRHQHRNRGQVDTRRRVRLRGGRRAGPDGQERADRRGRVGSLGCFLAAAAARVSMGSRRTQASSRARTAASR